MTTPSSIYTGAPSLTHETLGDQASQIFYEDSVERFRNYLNRFETVYVHPASLLIRQSFATNPVTTVFLVSLVLLVAVPVTVFLSASFFSVILVVLGTISTGILLIVAIQSVLFIILLLSILSSSTLSVFITGIFYAISLTVTTVTPSIQYTRDISVGARAEGIAAVQSLATSISERAPGWRDTIIDQTSALHEHAAKIPFSQWSSQFMQLLYAIPWSRMYSTLLTAFNATISIIHTGVSIAQLLTLAMGLIYQGVHAMFFCLRMLVVVFQQGFALSTPTTTQNADIPLQVVREDPGTGEGVGVSTGVSPAAGSSRLSQKAREVEHETQAEAGPSGALGDDNAGFSFVDTKGGKSE